MGLRPKRCEWLVLDMISLTSRAPWQCSAPQNILILIHLLFSAVKRNLLLDCRTYWVARV